MASVAKAFPIRTERVKTAYQARVEWVPLSNIFVDSRAQRPFDAKWAQKIAADFDPDKLGLPAIVAVAEDRFAVIDGQHRCEATRIAMGENQQIECEVIRGIDIARAAELYRGRNTIRRPQTIDYFLAGVTAKDPECVAIIKILEDLGIKVMRGGANDNIIVAVASLQKLYRMGTVPHPGRFLKETLMLAIEVWGRKAETWNGDLLIGLGLILARHGGEIDMGALEKKLRGFTGGALGVLGRARSWREATGGSVSQCVSRVIVAAYNTGRPKTPLPEWGHRK